ncbi:MAG TPA: hypothetical protein VHK70_07335 [Burkholderiaceae bacterium]|jgi:hypothetical protein|nr:hypothetical protein [Burkholderiaceae bacterium]
MSALTLALPGTVAAVVRSLVGVGFIAALLMIFRPLVNGLLRSALLVFKPRRSLEQRQGQKNFDSVLLVNRMAKELEATQPNLAAELRLLAARG